MKGISDQTKRNIIRKIEQKHSINMEDYNLTEVDYIELMKSFSQLGYIDENGITATGREYLDKHNFKIT